MIVSCRFLSFKKRKARTNSRIHVYYSASFSPRDSETPEWLPVPYLIFGLALLCSLIWRVLKISGQRTTESFKHCYLYHVSCACTSMMTKLNLCWNTCTCRVNVYVCLTVKPLYKNLTSFVLYDFFFLFNVNVKIGNVHVVQNMLKLKTKSLELKNVHVSDLDRCKVLLK